MENEYKEPLVSIIILDFDRPNESSILLKSLQEKANFEKKIIYISNGGSQDYVIDSYKNGLIDTLILNNESEGCGLGTRRGFQSAMSEWVFYIQVDQFLNDKIEQKHVDKMIEVLQNPRLFYIDLAGNQGQGNPSERASFFNRKKYLSIPGLDTWIGGPGKYANYQWTENLLQEYMKKEGLKFSSFYSERNLPFFIDNGKWSKRSYPCGAETLHSTDEKKLFILKPFKQRCYNFPNLKLNDQEWEMILNGTWPKEGMIPEADKKHSFKHWN